jgi:DNA-binding response OmpR family regulator
MQETKVLIIEDDAAIRQGLVDAVSFSGYTALEAGDADRGMDMAVKMDYDLLLLDIVLPHGDGFEILKKVRQTRPTLPVIVLTARGGEADRVKGLNLGADDYVVKPFSVKELLARVDAVLRRSPQRPKDLRKLKIPGGEVDFFRCEARFGDGERLELSEREMELLRYLAQNPGRVVSREEILSNVWRINPRGVYETRTIDMHIARLREKLRDDPENPEIILTVRGTGYKFGMEKDSQ